MNEEINLCEILKDCPKGIEFYSSLFGKVTFDRISYGRIIVNCIDLHKLVTFNQVGKYVIEISENNGTCFSSECILFPSKNQRDWSKFTAPWYNKEKFNPKTLKSFDKVLIFSAEDMKWQCSLFSHYNEEDVPCPFVCIDSFCYQFCIPYNDETKHIVGTTKEAPEYYKYWED